MFVAFLFVIFSLYCILIFIDKYTEFIYEREWSVEYYDNGNIKVIYLTLEGLKDGFTQHYYESGNIKRVEFWDDGYLLWYEVYKDQNKRRIIESYYKKDI